MVDSQTGYRAVEADAYFTDTRHLYRYFAPGVIRPDEGTIELTLSIDRAMDHFGNKWDWAFRLIPAKPLPEGKSLMGIFMPRLPDVGLTFLIRNAEQAYNLNVPYSFYEPGEVFNLACTWKAGHCMRMYKNGRLLSSMPIGKAINPEDMPYSFSALRTEPFHVDRLRICTRELEDRELVSDPSVPYVETEDTSLISCDSLTVTRKHMTTWHRDNQYSTLIPAWRAEAQCFTEGEDVFFPVMSVNHSRKPMVYTVEIRAKSPSGEVVMERNVEIVSPNDGEYHVAEVLIPELNTRGIYDLSTSILLEGRKISEYPSTISNLPPDDLSVADGALSRTYGQHYPEDFDTSFFKRINASATRAFQCFRWANVEPVRGTFVWEAADCYVDKCRAADLEILGVLGYPPRWAALKPTDEEIAASMKMSELSERWKPRDIDEWANYVYQTVLRYRGHVKYWEIYNEVNFHFPYAAHSFSGSTEEYLALLKVAYREAKRADPSCKILVSGFAVPHPRGVDNDMPMQLTDAKYAEGYYDIYNVHGYLGSQAFKGCIENLKVQRPGTKYWMTEDMPFQIMDPRKRVYNTLYSYMSFLEDGYERFFHMGTPSMDVFTTLTSLSPTRSFHAMGVLQNHVRKCDTLVCRYDDFIGSSGLSLRHCLRRTDGKYLSILGSDIGEYEVEISGDVENAEDVYGHAVSLEASNGITTMRLENVLYITSAQQLRIRSAKALSGLNLLTNGGFEDNIGDIAAGIDGLKPTNWVFRGQQTDPGGEVRISEEAASGRYSVYVRSTGKGRVYLFQDVSIPSPGEFRVTAKFKRLSGGPALVPYMSLYNRDLGTGEERRVTDVSDTDFSEASETFIVTAKTIQNAALVLGILSGSGEILIDDVRMELVAPSSESATCVDV